MVIEEMPESEVMGSRSSVIIHSDGVIGILV